MLRLISIFYLESYLTSAHKTPTAPKAVLLLAALLLSLQFDFSLLRLSLYSRRLSSTLCSAVGLISPPSRSFFLYPNSILPYHSTSEIDTLVSLAADTSLAGMTRTLFLPRDAANNMQVLCCNLTVCKQQLSFAKRPRTQQQPSTSYATCTLDSSPLRWDCISMHSN